MYTLTHISNDFQAPVWTMGMMASEEQARVRNVDGGGLLGPQGGYPLGQFLTQLFSDVVMATRKETLCNSILNPHYTLGLALFV